MLNVIIIKFYIFAKIVMNSFFKLHGTLLVINYLIVYYINYIVLFFIALYGIVCYCCFYYRHCFHCCHSEEYVKGSGCVVVAAAADFINFE